MFCFTEIQQCTHIKATGHRCGSPALKGKFYCYFHAGLIRGVKRPIDSQIDSVSILENPESIQVALMHAHSQVLRKEIDYRTGVLLIRILNLAIRNGRRANFNWNQDEMVRELPNYGEQYLAEHPDLDSPEPDREIAINKDRYEDKKDADVVPAAVVAGAQTSGAPGSRPFFGANLGSDTFTHITPPTAAKTTTAAPTPEFAVATSLTANTAPAVAPTPAPPAISSPAITSLAAKTKPAAAAQPQPPVFISPTAAKTTTAAAAQKSVRKNAIHKINRSANRAAKVVELKSQPSAPVSAATPAHPREPAQPNLLHADTIRDIRQRINRARRGNVTDMKTLFDLAGIFPHRRNGNSTVPQPGG